MPIRPFRDIPRDSVEWARYLQKAEVTVEPGSVGGDEIGDHEVTFVKIQNITPNRLLGRDTAPAGTVQELLVDGGLEFTGSGIQRSELTGDIVAVAGANTTEFRDFSAVSVLGRSANSTGAPAEIAAASNGHYLRRIADAVGFGAIADSDLPSTIARDSEVTAAISALNLSSGTYTPTVTGVANVDSVTAHQCHYLRVGSIVQVSGYIAVDATAATTDTQVRISLPIASSLGAVGDCAGCAYSNTAAFGAAILADATNDAALMEYVAGDTSSREFWFSFSYRVI